MYARTEKTCVLQTKEEKTRTPRVSTAQRCKIAKMSAWRLSLLWLAGGLAALMVLTDFFRTVTVEWNGSETSSKGQDPQESGTSSTGSVFKDAKERSRQSSGLLQEEEENADRGAQKARI